MNWHSLTSCMASSTDRLMSLFARFLPVRWPILHPSVVFSKRSSKRSTKRLFPPSKAARNQRCWVQELVGTSGTSVRWTWALHCPSCGRRWETKTSGEYVLCLWVRRSSPESLLPIYKNTLEPGTLLLFHCDNTFILLNLLLNFLEEDPSHGINNNSFGSTKSIPWM